jgi:hypothetical protein
MAPILRQENTHTAYISLSQPFEKSLYPAPAFVTVNDAILLIVMQVREWHIDIDGTVLCVGQQFLLRPRILRTRERLIAPSFIDRSGLRSQGRNRRRSYCRSPDRSDKRQTAS